uniref:hypothetical protein n=1 Tax=Hydrogenimonas cancrithermarum TaxID=2993563 RepID=UPI0038737556
MLSDDGAWCRYRDAQCRLSAQCASHAGKLRSTKRPGGSFRPTGADSDLLRGTKPPRSVLFLRSCAHGAWRGQSPHS